MIVGSLVRWAWDSYSVTSAANLLVSCASFKANVDGLQRSAWDACQSEALAHWQRPDLNQQLLENGNMPCPAGL